MHKNGQADMPLHYGKVPEWLASRMSLLGGAIVEAIVTEYGRSALLQRMSDPFWFQSLGCVLGMDWHSSGITTSVMGALKKSVNRMASDLGIYICGGRGPHARKTPSELAFIAGKTGMDGALLTHNSRLAAKIDNAAVQDGFQLYLHSFILTVDQEWAVIQQGMNTETRLARRYHWHSRQVVSFLVAPHSCIYGENQGRILNLTDRQAGPAKDAILGLIREDPGKTIREIRHLTMPRHHAVRSTDVNLKRLGAVLALAHERYIAGIEDLLLLQGVGPRTIQSLALVSEIIHGAPARFEDPARFSFAHGGKDGHPFPVPVNVYDETIALLERSIQKAKLGTGAKDKALKSLSKAAALLEERFLPNGNLDNWIDKERRDSWKYGGRTVYGKVQKPDSNVRQLELF